MKRIAKFQKVSKEQFLEGTEGILTAEEAEKVYEEIRLPRRATKALRDMTSSPRIRSRLHRERR